MKGALTITYERDVMPYTKKAKRFFRAREHGFVPDNPKLRKLSPEQAEELLEESTRVEGQKKAMRGGR